MNAAALRKRSSDSSRRVPKSKCRVERGTCLSQLLGSVHPVGHQNAFGTFRNCLRQIACRLASYISRASASADCKLRSLSEFCLRVPVGLVRLGPALLVTERLRCRQSRSMVVKRDHLLPRETLRNVSAENRSRTSRRRARH